jgi:Na+/H+ antiporter NhaA
MEFHEIYFLFLLSVLILTGIAFFLSLFWDKIQAIYNNFINKIKSLKKDDLIG